MGSKITSNCSAMEKEVLRSYGSLLQSGFIFSFITEAVKPAADLDQLLIQKGNNEHLKASDNGDNIPDVQIVGSPVLDDQDDVKRMKTPKKSPSSPLTFLSIDSESDIIQISTPPSAKQKIQQEAAMVETPKLSMEQEKVFSLYDKQAEISNRIRQKIASNCANSEISQLMSERHELESKISEAEHALFQTLQPCSITESSSDDCESDIEFLYTTTGSDHYSIPQDRLKKITEANHRVFHHSSFRGVQLSAINEALSSKDVFITMPTGGGKSLCFQLPGIIQGGLTVVVSPLLSLINDQVTFLKSIGIPSASATSDTSVSQLTNCICSIRFLYITPEKLIGDEAIIELLKAIKITRFVIDEAHCVSQWGFDFRPEYSQLGKIRDQFRNVPIMALTATATNTVKDQIISSLKISGCSTFQQSFNRGNIFYEVMTKSGGSSQAFELIFDWISSHGYQESSGLIFCLSKSDTEKLSAWLNEKGLKAAFYHAKLTAAQRNEIQSQWMSESVKIVVATVAFGMGIDKPNVRFVIHLTMPKSLEGYYQESGRAGRDGLEARALLLFSISEKQRVHHLITTEDSEGNRKPSERIEAEEEMLNKVCEYGIEKIQCRRVILMKYFGEDFDVRQCHCMCDNCSNRADKKIQEVDVTKHAENLAKLVDGIQKKRSGAPFPTTKYVVSLYFGSGIQKIKVVGDDKLDQYGLGVELKGLNQAYRIISALIDRNVLKTEIHPTKHGSIEYLRTGTFFYTVEKGLDKVTLVEIDEN